MWHRRTNAATIDAPRPSDRIVAVLDSQGDLADLIGDLVEDEVRVVGHVDDAQKLVAAGNACVLVIHGPDADADVFAELARLKARGGLPSLVVAEKPTATLLRNALRAGVSDVVGLTGTELADALARSWSSGPSHDHHGGGGGKAGKVVAVFSPKGGVGCTTLALNLAALAAARSTCVVVDADLPFCDIAVMLGIEPRSGLADLTGADLDTERLYNAMVTHSSGIKALPGPPDPARAEVVTTQTVANVLGLLREEADLILVDTACAFDDLTLAVLESSDEVLLVTTTDLASVKNAKVAKSTMALLGIPEERVHLVINKVAGKGAIGVGDIENHLGPADAVVPDDPAFGRAAGAGDIGVNAVPRSAVTKTLTKLLDRVAAEA